MAHNPEDRAPGKVEQRIADLVGRRSVWVVIMAVAIGIPLAKAFNTKTRPTPARIRQIPEFKLTNQEGKPFGTENLRGKLWVANFIFTSCPTICPRLTHAMAIVRKRSVKGMQGAVQFVSFTVDPTRDTPQVLDAYAAANHARGSWNFLTGSVADVRKVVLEGFRIGMGVHAGTRDSGADEKAHRDGESPLEHANHDDATELLQVAHGQQLVLVDKDLWIRGFYNPDDEGIDRLELEMGAIANSEGVIMNGLDPAVPIPAGSMPAGNH